MEMTAHGQFLYAQVVFVIYELISLGGGDVSSYKTDRGTNEEGRDYVRSRPRADLGAKPGKWWLIEGRPFSSHAK